MWKKYLAILWVILALAGTAAAEEGAASQVSADGWTAVEEDGAITVTDENGNQLQRLEHQSDEGVLSVLISDDYNFDGKADLAALTSLGNANGYYTVWLRNAGGGFEECPALGEVCAPRCNSLMQSIESFERTSAAAYVETEYRWKEGELKAVWKREVEYLDANGINIQVMEGFPEAEESAVREWRIPSEQWNTAMKLVGNAEWIAFTLYREDVTKAIIAYGGMEEIDGRLYYAFSVESEGETVSVIYLDEAQPYTALLDDQPDGVVNPQWQVSLNGEKTERNS